LLLLSVDWPLLSKLWIFNVLCEQDPLEHLGTNLEDDLCHQAFISWMKHAELCVRALDGIRKDLTIHVLEVLVKIQPPTWPKKGLVLW